MNTTADRNELLAHFPDAVPLLPLPDVVCFPGLLVPFHVSAPRDHASVREALETEQFLALALLAPGWQVLRAPHAGRVCKTVCAVQIAVAQPLSDSGYNLILRGLARAHVVAEPDFGRPYRQARLAIRPDRHAKRPTIDREHRRAELLAHVRNLHPDVLLDHALHRSGDAETSLGELCDLIAYSLRLPPQSAQEVLDEVDVDLRSDLVLAQLRQVLRDKPFRSQATECPPVFSTN